MPYGGVFESANTADKIKELEIQTQVEGFWNDAKQAEKIFAQLSQLKDSYYPWKELIDEINSLSELMELYRTEEDEAIEQEIDSQILALEDKFRPLKLKTLLNGEFDKNDCFLSIHAGAGGTEACDWANMLFRLYIRWCERHNFKCEVLDVLEDEGGIKSATIKVAGAYAFGYLKGEAGVHQIGRASCRERV